MQKNGPHSARSVNSLLLFYRKRSFKRIPLRWIKYRFYVLSVGVGSGLAEGDGDGEGVGFCVGVGVGFCVGEGVGVTVIVGVGVGVGVGIMTTAVSEGVGFTVPIISGFFTKSVTTKPSPVSGLKLLVISYPNGGSFFSAACSVLSFARCLFTTTYVPGSTLS